MKCVICKTGAVQVETVEAEVKVGNDRVLVLLQTDRCQQCGEAYYSPATLRRLETIQKEFERKKVTAESVGHVYRLSALP